MGHRVFAKPLFPGHQVGGVHHVEYSTRARNQWKVPEG